jgi:aarF domain-containing kinase
MSRSQDIFGILRGIQLVLNSSVKTQEVYLKHLWSHSSVRDVLEKNFAQTQQCGEKFVKNPTKELENIGSVLKETLERTSLVAEGVKKYAISERSSKNVSSIDTQLGGEVKSIKNLENLDIASITLRELENLLAEHNKIRDVNLRHDIVAASKKQKSTIIKEEVKTDKIINEEPVKRVYPPPKSPTTDAVKDEKQVENMISFISNYNQTGDQQPTPVVAKEFVPEVSNLMSLRKKFLPFFN